MRALPPPLPQKAGWREGGQGRCTRFAPQYRASRSSRAFSASLENWPRSFGRAKNDRAQAGAAGKGGSPGTGGRGEQGTEEKGGKGAGGVTSRERGEEGGGPPPSCGGRTSAPCACARTS